MKNAEKNEIQVDLIRSGLRDLKEEIEDMEKDEKETEKLNEIVDIVEKVIEFNNQNQKGQGLKILSRLPITLAQLKAGNNSGKLKNEIRQLLYLLHYSKKLSKTIYNKLVNTI